MTKPNQTNDEEIISELAGPMCTALASLSLGRDVEALLNTHVLLAIADEPGCTSKYLQDKFGMVQSTIYKTLKKLGAKKGGGTKAPGLIVAYKDGKRHRHKLTDKGRVWVNKALDQLEDRTLMIARQRMIAARAK